MIAQNLERIRQRISFACSKADIDPDSVRIIAVSKGRTSAEIEEAINAGITDIGENKVQEALLKFNEIRRREDKGQGVKWHMVGHLQTNKAKQAVEIFDLIHSVDSLHLAQAINKQAARDGKVQDILVEIRTSFELTKFGIEPAKTVQIIKAMTELKNINIKGLMTIAPAVSKPEETRIYFRCLRELRGQINSLKLTAYGLELLSMGMTDDFEIAVEEGSNMVRIGRAIFD